MDWSSGSRRPSLSPLVISTSGIPKLETKEQQMRRMYKACGSAADFVLPDPAFKMYIHLITRKNVS